MFRLLYPNKIIYVDEKLKGILVPSQFCIIRPEEEKMDSIVLKWYLESKLSQKELESKITGSIIKTMTLANLRTVTIPNISKGEQLYMKELIRLWEREKEISEQIIEQKDKLYQHYLEKIVKRGEKDDNK